MVESIFIINLFRDNNVTNILYKSSQGSESLTGKFLIATHIEG